MEQLQEGYVTSVAATAGCSAEFIRRDIYGFDVRLVRPQDPGTQEVAVMAQLKNTTTLKPDPAKPWFSYQFDKRENLLRLTEPRKDPKAILLVMVTTPGQKSWTECDHESLVLRHCCYWAYLEGQAVRPDVRSPTVHVPTINIFDSVALGEIMDKLDQGVSLQ